MSDYRVDTDRQQTTVVASCPEGCQGFELEVSGDPDAVDTLVEKVLEAYDDCADCGGSFDWVRQDEQPDKLD